MLFLAPAEGSGWREGAEREGGGRAADSPVAGGATRGGERERKFHPQTEVNWSWNSSRRPQKRGEGGWGWREIYRLCLICCFTIFILCILQCSFHWFKSVWWSLSQAGVAMRENWLLSCRRHVAARRSCRTKPRTCRCALRQLRTLPPSPACSWVRLRADWPPQRQSWFGLRPGRGIWSFVWAAFSLHWRERWALERGAEEAGGGAQGGARRPQAPYHATKASPPCAPRCRLLKVKVKHTELPLKQKT